MREHPAQLLLAVLSPFTAVVVDVRVEGGRDEAAVRDPRQKVRIYQRTVLEAMARIGSRHQTLHPLVCVQDHVDGHVAVGVDPYLPAGPVRLFDGFVNLLLCHREDAEVV